MRKAFNNDWKFKSEDGQWRCVTLPHDAMLVGGRKPEAKGGSAVGFFLGGKYSYVKEINMLREELGKHYTLEFEGVYRNAKIHVNGNVVATCSYGYIPFFVVLDDYLKEGINEIRVDVDNSKQPDSRWYSGAGIYRSVWLHIQEKTRIALNGIKIKTLSVEPARIKIEVKHNGGKIYVQVRDSDNSQIVAIGEGDNIELSIPNAKLWNEYTPHLYDVIVKLVQDEQVIEEVHKSFGIRKVYVDKEGLFINGEKTLLKGGCIHHDNGILGACEYEESAERKIRILKEHGFNAIRCAHNPCSEALLAACDKYGMYIMDETWDMWYRKKNAYDYANDFAENYTNDIRAIVDKDFNHPSVIMYSIGNEVSEPAEKKGVVLAKEMVDLFHQLDDTRIVTGGFNLMIIANAAKGQAMYKEDGGLDESQSKDMSGMNSTMFNMIASMTGSGMNKAANGKKADIAVSPVLDLLDVAGYNYASGRYAEDMKRHPNRLIIGSETFPQDLAKNWKMVENMPNLIGDFMWTAWDYLGEAGLGAWSYEKDAKGFAKPYPWLLADTGVFDILGNPTGEALWSSVIWNMTTEPEIAVRPCNHPHEKLIKAAWRGTNAIPSWSWRGCDGNKVVVEVYANGKAVELFLNGKRVGKKKLKYYKAEFKLRYMAGILEAVVYDDNGREIGRKQLESGKGEVRPLLKSEQMDVKPGEICYVDVVMSCDNGIVDCNSDEKLYISVENGELLAFGSANPRTEERFYEGSYTTYYGKAQAIVRAGNSGVVKVTAKAVDYTNFIEINIK